MKLLDPINQLLIRFKPKSDKTCFKNILVVSNTALGDTILSTPAIKTIKKSFPDVKSIFLVNKKTYPLFKDFEYADEILVYTGSFLNLLSIVYKLRKRKLDTVFLLHSNGPQDIFIALMSGARNILKATKNKNHSHHSIFLNKIPDILRHEVDLRLDLVREFGTQNVDGAVQLPGRYYKQEMNFSRIDGIKKVVGFQVGAAYCYRMWPIENFLELAKYIVHQGYSVVITGTKQERHLGDYLEKRSAGIINMCGQLSIDQLPFLIKKFKVLVSNDTGTLHMAVALNIPTVSLFGASDPSCTGPYQDLTIHKVIHRSSSPSCSIPKERRTNELMKHIEVSEVAMTLEALLKVLV